MKGTIVFDVDGVLLDFYAPFLQWYNKRHETNFRVSDLTTYDIAAGFKIDPQTIVDFHEEAICASLPLLESDVSVFFSCLKKAGYRIVLNTDFPKAEEAKRIDNLADHWLQYDHLHFGKKADLSTFYDDIVLIVEDNPKWIHLYLSQGYTVGVPHRDYLREEPLMQDQRIVRYDRFWNFYSFLGLDKE